jgi:hypothetical protein
MDAERTRIALQKQPKLTRRHANALSVVHMVADVRRAAQQFLNARWQFIGMSQ